ncbi:MAG: hypothetical protein WKG07_05450 [Hymenobacter sp.]
MANFVPNYLCSYEQQHGWQLLFDGKTSQGWRSAKGPAFPAGGWQASRGHDIGATLRGQRGRQRRRHRDQRRVQRV